MRKSSRYILLLLLTQNEQKIFRLRCESIKLQNKQNEKETRISKNDGKIGKIRIGKFPISLSLSLSLSLSTYTNDDDDDTRNWFVFDLHFCTKIESSHCREYSFIFKGKEFSPLSFSFLFFLAIFFSIHPQQRSTLSVSFLSIYFGNSRQNKKKLQTNKQKRRRRNNFRISRKMYESCGRK